MGVLLKKDIVWMPVSSRTRARYEISISILCDSITEYTDTDFVDIYVLLDP